MKKEVFLAIAIGFALGLVITFGIWTANKSLKNLPQAKPTPTPEVASETPAPSASATSNTTPSSNLTVSAPADEALLSTNKVTVTGRATPGAVVVVLSEDASQIVLADAKGDFSLNVNLVAGYNFLRLQAYDKAGVMTETAITVTYSTQV